MTHVLVVDDDAQICRTLRVSLKAHGYDVDVANDGTRALLLASANHPDVVLLDLGLPDIDGVDVLRRLRVTSAVPVLILSVRGADADKIEALDAGADDYVTKPFSMPELLARLRATLRRLQPTETEAVVETERFRLDLLDKRATVADSIVHLTPTEWELVGHLVRNPDRLVTQRELLRHVWGPNCPHEPAYLRVHIGHVRRKLEANPARPKYFVTEPGLGYRFLLPGARELTRPTHAGQPNRSA